MKIYNYTHKINNDYCLPKKNVAPTFSANQVVVKSLSDRTLKLGSLVATSLGLATLAIFQKNKTKEPDFKSEEIKIHDIEPTPIRISDKPIVTSPAQLSLFHMHDFHGQSERMERAYTASEEFQNGKLQQSDIFEETLPTDKLKLCSGDMFLGGSHERIAMVNEFLNNVGVIATALGNHECDASLADFAGLINGKNYRLVSTNLHPNKKNVINKIISDSFIIETNGNKYGIIGVSPVDFMKHASHPEEISKLKVDDLEATIKEVQDDVNLIKQNGVNKIILLSHLGIDFERSIAQKVNDLDIILGGHTHTFFKEAKEGENLFYSPKGEPVLIVQSGKDGEYIGVPNLKFDEYGQIVDIDYQVIRTDDYERHKELKANFEKYSKNAKALGNIRSVDSRFEKTYIEENPNSNFMLDCLKSETGADIAVMNSASMRNIFSTGKLSTFDLENVNPFMDKIAVIRASEKELVEAIKQRVKATSQSPNYRPGILQVSGLRYEFNKQTGDVVAMSFVDKSGKEIKIDVNNPSDKIYTVAVNKFCVTDEYSGLGLKHRLDDLVVDDGFEIKKYIADWCLKHPEPIDIKIDGRISAK